jgi:DNA ligase-1
LVKSLDSIYEAGKRAYTWLKFKPERDSIDCVVVKALYGKGRRAGYFSSFELAVRDPVQKKLYTVGRVSNIPDLLMARLRDVVTSTKVGEDKEGVYVKPTIVLEVTYQEIQRTEDYTSGYALRVPKVVRVRDDKTVEDVDTTEKLQKLYEMQYEERFKAKTI